MRPKHACAMYRSKTKRTDKSSGTPSRTGTKAGEHGNSGLPKPLRLLKLIGLQRAAQGVVWKNATDSMM